MTIRMDALKLKHHDLLKEYFYRKIGISIFLIESCFLLTIIEEMDSMEFLNGLGSLSPFSWTQMMQTNLTILPLNVREVIQRESELRSSLTVSYLLNKIAALTKRVEELEKK